jgi:hypothetical protein
VATVPAIGLRGHEQRLAVPDHAEIGLVGARTVWHLEEHRECLSELRVRVADAGLGPVVVRELPQSAHRR